MTSTGNQSNRVRERRLALGFTQAELSERVHISRTAITAIEGDRIVPSVATALALARELDCTVEELFGIASSATASTLWAWQPTTTQRFWQAEVSGKLWRYPATTAPMMTPLPDDQEQSASGAGSIAGDTVVLACCDPAAGLLASQFQQVTGLRLIVLPRSSRQSLEMLKSGLVHFAGLHFSTAEDPDRNAEVVREVLGSDYGLLRLCRWQEGIALSGGSAHRTVRSVLQSKLTWIGREEGSGARRCLDQLLSGRSSPRRIASNHHGVATAVHSGWADAGVCVRLVSEEAGLRFLPVQEEAFDLCYLRSFSADRRFKAFARVVRSSVYRKLLIGLPGYDASETGEAVA
ncbi:MAG: substrate-binding domain-containing protein [Planctomycetaceae bacterium]